MTVRPKLSPRINLSPKVDPILKISKQVTATTRIPNVFRTKAQKCPHRFGEIDPAILQAYSPYPCRPTNEGCVLCVCVFLTIIWGALSPKYPTRISGPMSGVENKTRHSSFVNGLTGAHRRRWQKIRICLPQTSWISDL